MAESFARVVGDVPVATASTPMPASGGWLGGAVEVATGLFSDYQKNKANEAAAAEKAAEQDWFARAGRELNRVYDAGVQGSLSGLQWQSQGSVAYRKFLSEGAERGFDIEGLKKLGAQYGFTGSFEAEQAKDQTEAERESRQALETEAQKNGITVQEQVFVNSKNQRLDLLMKELRYLDMLSEDEKKQQSGRAQKTVGEIAVISTSLGVDSLKRLAAQGFNPATASVEQRQGAILQVQQFSSQMQKMLLQEKAANPSVDISFANDIIKQQTDMALDWANGKVTLDALEKTNKITAEGFENNLPEETKRFLAFNRAAANNPVLQQLQYNFLLETPAGKKIFPSMFGEQSTTKTVESMTETEKKQYKDATPKLIKESSVNTDTRGDAVQMFKQVVDPDMAKIDSTNVQTMIASVIDDSTWNNLKSSVDQATKNAGADKILRYNDGIALSYNKWKDDVDKSWSSEWVGGVKSKAPERDITAYMQATVEGGRVVFKTSPSAVTLSKPHQQFLEKQVVRLNNNAGKEINNSIKAFSRMSDVDEATAAEIIGQRFPFMQQMEKPAKEAVPELLKKPEPEQPKTTAVEPQMSEEDMELLSILRSLSPEERLLLKTGVA